MHLLINTVLVYNFEVLHQVFFVFFFWLLILYAAPARFRGEYCTVCKILAPPRRPTLKRCSHIGTESSVVMYIKIR